MGWTRALLRGWRLRVERLAGFQQGFQAAEHAHPSGTRDTFGRPRRVFELVVDDSEQGGAVGVRFDLPGHTAGRLDGEVGMVETAVADDQPVWWFGIQHRVVAPQSAAVRGVVAEWCT